MRKLVIRFIVALAAFDLGISTALLLKRPVVTDKVLTPQLNPILVKSKPETPANPETPKKVETYSDVSFVVAVETEPLKHETRHINLSERGRTIVDLDLGEYIEDQEITVNFRDNAAYRMFERYRTSMTIALEGPHLDLTNWRHFDSPWVPLQSLGPRKFRALSDDQIDSSRFPTVTKKEIMKEVSKYSRDWPKLVQLIKDRDAAGESPCVVGVSSLYLRIEKKVGNDWVEAGLIELRVPMGC